jgi:hypothetical protein
MTMGTGGTTTAEEYLQRKAMMTTAQQVSQRIRERESLLMRAKRSADLSPARSHAIKPKAPDIHFRCAARGNLSRKSELGIQA